MSDHDELDLRQRYQGALNCQLQYEIKFSILQGQLALRDERIAALEEKIVHMSFELASSKAFEDKHRSTRRTPNTDGNGRDDGGDDDELFSVALLDANKHHHDPVGQPAIGDTAAAIAKNHRKALAGSLPWSFGSTSFGCTDTDYSMNDDEATASLEPSCPNDSCSSVPSTRFGKLFRKDRRPPKEERVVLEAGEMNGARWWNKGRQGQKSGDGEQRPPPCRRPPNRRRTEGAQLLSSLLSLEGVVFPSSFQDIVSKGIN